MRHYTNAINIKKVLIFTSRFHRCDFFLLNPLENVNENGKTFIRKGFYNNVSLKKDIIDEENHRNTLICLFQCLM